MHPIGDRLPARNQTNSNALRLDFSRSSKAWGDMCWVGEICQLWSHNIRREEKSMIRYIAVFTFLLIVGVCSYVVLNPGSYPSLVLCFASFVLCVAIREVAPVWKVIFLLITVSVILEIFFSCQALMAEGQQHSNVEGFSTNWNQKGLRTNLSTAVTDP
jgi:hypothetical protein